MSDESFAKSNAAYWAAHPAEAARILAESDAMCHLADGYEQEAVQELAKINVLMRSEAAVDLLTRVAFVIALVQLRCAALGIRAVPSWQEALERHGILRGTTIDRIKATFKQEATN